MIGNENLKNKEGLTLKEFLDKYDPNSFERPSVTVDTLLFTVVDKVVEDIRKLNEKELKILLVKRADHPCIRQWSIPGGFIGIEEPIEKAVKRNLEKKTNINNVYMEQLATFGDVNRDPRMRILSIAYMALVPKKDLNTEDGEADNEKEWFTISRGKRRKSEEGITYDLRLECKEKNIIISYKITEKYSDKYKGVTKEKEISYSINNESTSTIAFDHYKIINVALDRLKNKVEYTPIAFNLVDEYFTIADIQSIYEILLNRKFHRMEFMRKMKKMVIETDKINKEKGHRPAKYYKYNKDWIYEF